MSGWIRELRSAVFFPDEELSSRRDRFKEVFPTNPGWQRMEIASGQISSKPTVPAVRTAAEWIGGGPEVADRLAACRT
jgi:hypothetical protein